MAFTVPEMLRLFRDSVDDATDEDGGTSADRLMASDFEVHAWLDEAQKEFARRTQFFTDATTAEIVSPPVVANDAWVELDERIVEIHSAVTVTANRDLRLVSFNEMRRGAVSDDYGVSSTGNWRTATGTPTMGVLDMEPHRMRLAPVPVAADTLALFVTRLPLCDVAVGEDVEMEVRDVSHQFVLLEWMKHRAYGKADVDVFDGRLFALHLAAFERGCRDVRSDVDRKRRKARRVAYGGIRGYADVAALDVSR